MRGVKVDAPSHLTRFAFPAMRAQGYGRFVFTTFGRGMSAERTRPGLAAYAVGKSSDDVDFGRQPAEPEAIAEHGADIEGPVAA
jgi:hypothetical protein